MTYYVGDVVLVRGLALTPQKDKFCIFIAVSPNKFLLINSENREAYDCIPILKKHARAFPEHDSYIGCKNIFAAEDHQIASAHGQLDEQELKALAEKIKTSKFFAPASKAEMIGSIDAEIDRRLAARAAKN